MQEYDGSTLKEFLYYKLMLRAWNFPWLHYNFVYQNDRCHAEVS